MGIFIRHAERRLADLRIQLLVLRHEHVEWLARIIEWDTLRSRGEPLDPEIAYARANLDRVKKSIAATERACDFWRRIAQRPTKTMKAA